MNTPNTQSHRWIPTPDQYPTMTTQQLRDQFLVEGLFEPDAIHLQITDLDRAIAGGAMPVNTELKLPIPEQLRADYFCQRRELGIINIGGAGTVTVDETQHKLNNKECLYVGRGSKQVSFRSDAPSTPATPATPSKYYLVSYPAHTNYPTQKSTPADANVVELGSDKECNRRTIYQYIHEGGAQSCQLVMGYTQLHSGSCWNTMPCHTHNRRSELYFYFDIDPGHQVLHQMGLPEETRGLWLGNDHGVLSPPWSIHSGVGTSSYAFIWCMGGENQSFDDMDPVAITSLR